MQSLELMCWVALLAPLGLSVYVLGMLMAEYKEHKKQLKRRSYGN